MQFAEAMHVEGEKTRAKLDKKTETKTFWNICKYMDLQKKKPL